MEASMPKQYVHFSLLLSLALLSLTAHSQTLDFHLNNDAVSLDYTNRLSDSALNLGAGILHHQDNGEAFYGNLFVADNINKQSNLLAGVGGRLYYINADSPDIKGTTVSLGGFINYDIPNITNLSVRADIYYAPDVLSFDDIEKNLDMSVRVQYRIIEQAWVYLGYRNAEVRPVHGNEQTIDEGGHVGLMLWF